MWLARRRWRWSAGRGAEPSTLLFYLVSLALQVVEDMQRQVSAERKKRATILESEGLRESAINVAEGEKTSTILASEVWRRWKMMTKEFPSKYLLSVCLYLTLFVYMCFPCCLNLYTSIYPYTPTGLSPGAEKPSQRPGRGLAYCGGCHCPLTRAYC